MTWYYQIGRQVWPYEIGNSFFRDRRQRHGPTLAEFWGPAQGAEACDSADLLRTPVFMSAGQV